MRHNITYLALGDSYTIGYKVPYDDNYPNQVVALLRAQHLDVADPEIVAYPGWNTTDLLRALSQEKITDTFSFVTICIGNNDLVQNWPLSSYRLYFEQLLTRAIAYTGGRAAHVFVMSLPDASLSVRDVKDTAKRAKDIAAYNVVNKEVALAYHCPYIDITRAMQPHVTDEAYYMPDWVHLTAKGYAIWAAIIAPVIVGGFQ